MLLRVRSFSTIQNSPYAPSMMHRSFDYCSYYRGRASLPPTTGNTHTYAIDFNGSYHMNTQCSFLNKRSLAWGNVTTTPFVVFSCWWQRKEILKNFRLIPPEAEELYLVQQYVAWPVSILDDCQRVGNAAHVLVCMRGCYCCSTPCED